MALRKMKKNSKDLEEDFLKNIREGLPSRPKKTLEQALEDKLWNKEDDDTESDGPEWV